MKINQKKIKILLKLKPKNYKGYPAGTNNNNTQNTGVNLAKKNRTIKCIIIISITTFILILTIVFTIVLWLKKK